MRVYRVGGAVRDRLLGEPVKDVDWVVVGETVAAMRERGFREVGRDFPVFLHPETGEEYALARTERKTGPGYRGFRIHAEPTVTLEQDLARRDLTINAMAETEDGTLIDPFGGRADLEAGLLRHVSDAFVEDPVRILRVARFAARFAGRGFRVAEETRALMVGMVADGEVDALVPERVWQELVRALSERTPSAFVRVLRDCGALARILPELDALFGVPQPAEFHPEIDTGEHVLRCLDAAARDDASSEARYAVLLHDLGKALTPEAEWPAHHGHELYGLEPVAAVNARLATPRAHAELALLVCEHHLRCHRLLEMRPGKVMALIEALDGLRRPGRVTDFVAACSADLRGRGGREDDPYPQGTYLFRALAAAGNVDVAPLRGRGLQGKALGDAIREARVRAIGEVEKPIE